MDIHCCLEFESPFWCVVYSYSPASLTICLLYSRMVYILKRYLVARVFIIFSCKSNTLSSYSFPCPSSSYSRSTPLLALLLPLEYSILVLSMDLFSIYQRSHLTKYNKPTAVFTFQTLSANSPKTFRRWLWRLKQTAEIKRIHVSKWDLKESSPTR